MEAAPALEEKLDGWDCLSRRSVSFIARSIGPLIGCISFIDVWGVGDRQEEEREGRKGLGLARRLE